MGLNCCVIWILYSSRLAVENYSSCLVVDVFNWNPGVAQPDQLVQLSDVEQHPGFRLDPILTAKDPLSFCIANQRAYLFIADGKVAWGRLGKSISLNSGFACEIASLNFDSFDQNRKETR